MLKPCWILVVGPAAAGKTTVAQRIAQTFPTFRMISDLAALEELFCLNESRSGRTRPRPTEKKAFFWPNIDWHRSEGRWATKKSSDGGYEILDADVWDEALRRVIMCCQAEPHVILEFARGTDYSYITLHNIDSNRVYEPSFRLIAEAVVATVKCFVVVHVTAPFDTRLLRNTRRRALGDHYVSDSVMRSVYMTDPFREQSVDFLKAENNFVTVVNIDTSRESSDAITYTLNERIETIIQGGQITI